MSDRSTNASDLLGALLDLIDVRIPQMEVRSEQLQAEIDELKEKLRAIPGRCFSEKAACARLGGIDRNTIKSLRDKGEIGFVRVGTRVLYPRRDLDEFIERNSLRCRHSRRLKAVS